MIEIRLSQASVSEPAVCPPSWIHCRVPSVFRKPRELCAASVTVVRCCEENLREDTGVEKPEVGDAG